MMETNVGFCATDPSQQITRCESMRQTDCLKDRGAAPPTHAQFGAIAKDNEQRGLGRVTELDDAVQVDQARSVESEKAGRIEPRFQRIQRFTQNEYAFSNVNRRACSVGLDPVDVGGRNDERSVPDAHGDSRSVTCVLVTGGHGRPPASTRPAAAVMFSHHEVTAVRTSANIGLRYRLMVTA
jgi:hypothetical protein